HPAALLLEALVAGDQPAQSTTVEEVDFFQVQDDLAREGEAAQELLQRIANLEINLVDVALATDGDHITVISSDGHVEHGAVHVRLAGLRVQSGMGKKSFSGMLTGGHGGSKRNPQWWTVDGERWTADK